jgi:hypothetical protein
MLVGLQEMPADIFSRMEMEKDSENKAGLWGGHMCVMWRPQWGEPTHLAVWGRVSARRDAVAVPEEMQ